MRKASGLSCEGRAYRVRREIVRERTEQGIDHACPWPERLETLPCGDRGMQAWTLGVVLHY